MTREFPFTYKGYLELTAALRDAGYAFAFFPEAPALLKSDAPFCLMRHDVDLDLEKALELARVEAAAGIRATYFIFVGTDHYNAFSRRGAQIVREIIERGHDIGLHFDCENHPEATGAQSLAAICDTEARMLENFFDRRINIVSYHRPNPLVLTGGAALSAPRPHTYMKLFTDNISYCSDSRGVWGHGNPISGAAFEKRKPLHILAHPAWWNENQTTPIETLENLCNRKHNDLEASIAKNCTVFNRNKNDGTSA